MGNRVHGVRAYRIRSTGFPSFVVLDSSLGPLGPVFLYFSLFLGLSFEYNGVLSRLGLWDPYNLFVP